MITAQILKNKKSDYLIYLEGPPENIISEVLPPDKATKNSLCFVSTSLHVDLVIQSGARILVKLKKLSLSDSQIASLKSQQVTLFETPSIAHGLSEVLPLFDGKMNRFRQKLQIHPTAFVAESASVHSSAQVGPFSFIGEGVTIGANSVIGPHCTIEAEAKVGAQTLLHSHVFIGARCLIGNHCEIHPHTTIGSDGFAFAPLADKTHRKIPQIGIVRIEDSVEIGSQCAIDRGALTETVIGQGTKMDNICHIAHNVQIGRNCLLAAGFVVAGSTVIGDNCTFSGQVGVTDHIRICSNVTIAGRSILSFNVDEPGVYGGQPLQPLKDYLRTQATLPHLPELRKRVKELESKLTEKSGDPS